MARRSTQFRRIWAVLAVGVLAALATLVTFASIRQQDRREPTYSPESYGAVGDGLHDDASAIQAAIDAAVVGGGHVVLGAKTYLCRSTVLLPTGADVVGERGRSVLHFTWNDQLGAASGGPAYLQNANPSDGNNDITLTNLVITGSTSGLPSGSSASHPKGLAPAIRLYNVDGFLLAHLVIANTFGMGINYHDSRRGSIVANVIMNTGRDGITGFWSHQSGPADMLVRGNKIIRPGDDGIAIVGSSGSAASVPRHIIITHNQIEGWPENPNGLLLGRGIVVQDASDVTIASNAIDHTFSDGLLIVGDKARPVGIAVKANRILHAGTTSLTGSYAHWATDRRSGIDVVDAEAVIATNNTIEGSRGGAVSVKGCSSCSIG